MKIQANHLFIIICLLAFIALNFSSCEYLGIARERQENQGKAIAKVYDSYLYEKDLKNVKTIGSTPEDSARVVDNFVKSWVKKELTLQKAKEYLPSDNSEIEEQVQEYRESLITFMYERELLSSKVDTEVSEEEINAYYNNNKAHFFLKNDIVYCRYFFMKNGFGEVDTVRKYMKSQFDEEASEALQQIGFQFSANFKLDGEWLSYDKLNEKLPRRLGAASENLKKNKLIEISDSSMVYFIKVHDYGLKGDIGPLSYNKQDISKIIVNKRKEEFLRTAKANLYNQAIKNRKVELYY